MTVKELPVLEQITAPPMSGPKKPRLGFIDWTRGLAASIMLQGHVFHSFAKPELRESSPYIVSQFIGGITPAIFLFLTGITLAFLLDGLERKRLEG
ncbi:MAG TPA: heparan-alpha-glucosaminide N-acetyltransferase domain-containing protein, partial [Bryobacteraceae bacterium]|nr:heparan-alpha-glucosaminide N-acetyltransferase domain-containing protein [Bryobacteraceae bacterium]